jgi:hypothetical protein
MTHRFAYLIAAGLALAAAPRASMSTSSPLARDAVAEVDVLVDGAPRPRYAHGGRWYVEALKGKEYALRLRNPYGVRVAVALRVPSASRPARHSAAHANADHRSAAASGARAGVPAGVLSCTAEVRRAARRSVRVIPDVLLI